MLVIEGGTGKAHLTSKDFDLSLAGAKGKK
jgi:hypothetical protein